MRTTIAVKIEKVFNFEAGIFKISVAPTKPQQIPNDAPIKTSDGQCAPTAILDKPAPIAIKQMKGEYFRVPFGAEKITAKAISKAVMV
jgi:hypothetical protein